MWKTIFLWSLIIAAIIISIGYFIKTKNKSFGDFLFTLFCYEFVVFIILGICFLIINCTVDYKTMQTKQINYSTKYELKCLKDYLYEDEHTKAQLDGKFILTCGYISGELENGVERNYITKYVAKDEKGIFRVEELKTEDKIGFIEDNENVIEIYKTKTWSERTDFGKWWFKDKNEKFNIEWKITDNVFHIPENSMITDKEIDLE